MLLPVMTSQSHSHSIQTTHVAIRPMLLCTLPSFVRIQHDVISRFISMCISSLSLLVGWLYDVACCYSLYDCMCIIIAVYYMAVYSGYLQSARLNNTSNALVYVVWHWMADTLHWRFILTNVSSSLLNITHSCNVISCVILYVCVFSVVIVGLHFHFIDPISSNHSNATTSTTTTQTFKRNLELDRPCAT